MDRMICIAFVIQLISNSINKIRAHICCFYRSFTAATEEEAKTAATMAAKLVESHWISSFFYSLLHFGFIVFVWNGMAWKEKEWRKCSKKYNFDVLYCINYMYYIRLLSFFISSFYFLRCLLSFIVAVIEFVFFVITRQFNVLRFLCCFFLPIVCPLQRSDGRMKDVL